MRSTIYLIFLLLISSTASAQWSRAGQDYIADFNRNMVTCDPTKGIGICKGFINAESYLDTVVGSLAMIAHHGGMDVTYPGGMGIDVVLPDHPFVDPNGADLPLHLTLYKPEGVTTTNSRATPLIVYLPGIFQDADIVQSYIAVSLLIKEGYQVLVVPNPLSSAYLKSFPAAAPATFKAEAEVVLSVVKWARQNLIDNSTQLSIVGGSYGAYLGARFVGLIAEHPEIAQLVDGQVSLLAPPLSMNFAIQRLDGLVSTSIKYRVHGISAEQFGDSFHKGLTTLVDWMQYDYVEHKATDFQARNNYADGAKKVFESFNLKNSDDVDKIRFRWIIDELEPENKAQYDYGQDLTGYWLNVASQHGFSRVRVLGADDDILSRRQDLVTIPGGLRTPAHLLIRTGGGHVGFIDEPMFADFVHLEFRLGPK